MWEKKQKFLVTIVWSLLLIFCDICLAGQWVNQRDVIKYPMLARLPSSIAEKGTLAPLEREEISKYGFTGLEIMIYLDDNKDPGQDYIAIEQLIQVSSGGQIKDYGGWVMRRKYYFRDYLTLLNRDGIKPGDIESKRIAINFSPPDEKGLGVLIFRFFKSEGSLKAEDSWIWVPKLRRIRRFSEAKRDDGFIGTVISQDDYSYREPWEEDHRILGIDSVNGRACLVIESKHRLNPEYYLRKRLTWVEKENFIDLHEEQFDRAGRLFKIIDKEWQQVKPWNYWARKSWNFYDRKTKERAVFLSSAYIFDQGLPDRVFTLENLQKEEIPGTGFNFPHIPKNIAELPPVPTVEWDFWERVGFKPELVK